MGKTLIIKGADFSENRIEEKVHVNVNITELFLFTDNNLIVSVGSDPLFGKLSASSVSAASNFVDVSKYKTLSVNVVNYNKNSGKGGICFYTDSNENAVISGSGIVNYDPSADNNTMKVQNIAVPINAKYVRLTVLMTEKHLFTAFGYE